MTALDLGLIPHAEPFNDAKGRAVQTSDTCDFAGEWAAGIDALDTQAENLTLQVHNVSLQALIEN